MRYVLRTVIVLALLLAALAVLAQQEVLVKFKKGVRPAVRDSILRSLKLKPRKTFPRLNLVLCENPEKRSVESLRQRARRVALIDYVEPNVVYAAEPQQQAEQIAQAKLRFKLEKLEEMQFAPGRLFVKIKPGTSPQEVRRFLQKKGLRIVREFPELSLVLCEKAPEVSMRAAVVSVAVGDMVKYVEPDFIVRALKIPNDPRFSQQWGLHNTGRGGAKVGADIDAPEAWDLQTGDPSVRVGIIDTGIDFRHKDLKANIWRNPGETGNGRESNGLDDDGNGYVDDWRGWDFANKDNDPQDDNGHGTHVAGIVAAAGNNGEGVSGVVWRAALVPLKFLRADGSGFVSAAIEAILYATDNGIRILNNSWGGTQFSQALEDAIRYASEHKVLFVAAAGNDGEDNDTSPHYPSNYDLPNVISVAASTDRDRRASFSNYGDRTVDLAAPGQDILSTYPGNRYELLSGTSMAAPFVTGVAALVLSEFPAVSFSHLRLRILGGTDFLPEWNGVVATGGRLNARKALSHAPVLALTTVYKNTTDTHGPYSISTYAIDDQGIASVKLIYSTDGSARADTLAMTAAGKDAFRAGIPGQSVGTRIRYYILASDVQGNRTESPRFTFEITSGGGCCGQFAISLPGPMNPFERILLFLVNALFLLSPLYFLKWWARRRQPA